MTTIQATEDVQRRIAERDALERRRERALTLAERALVDVHTNVIEGLFGDFDDDGNPYRWAEYHTGAEAELVERLQRRCEMWGLL